MRVHLNTSAWNRPFDDQASPRVRREAEAVAGIIAGAEAGRIEIIGSKCLAFEIGRNPDVERVSRLRQSLEVGALRFAMQTERGRGDYEKNRHRLQGSLTVDGLVALMPVRPERMKRRRVSRRG